MDNTTLIMALLGVESYVKDVIELLPLEMRETIAIKASSRNVREYAIECIEDQDVLKRIFMASLRSERFRIAKKIEDKDFLTDCILMEDCFYDRCEEEIYVRLIKDENLLIRIIEEPKVYGTGLYASVINELAELDNLSQSTIDLFGKILLDKTMSVGIRSNVLKRVEDQVIIAEVAQEITQDTYTNDWVVREAIKKLRDTQILKNICKSRAYFERNRLLAAERLKELRKEEITNMIDNGTISQDELVELVLNAAEGLETRKFALSKLESNDEYFEIIAISTQTECFGICIDAIKRIQSVSILNEIKANVKKGIIIDAIDARMKELKS